MSSFQPLEVDDAEPRTSNSGLVERLLQRLSGSATYSQLDTSDVHTERPSQDRWSPEENASLWSKLTYSYASGLITLGYSQPLHQEHLWDMAHKHEAAPLTARFHAALEGTQDPVKAPHVSSSIVCSQSSSVYSAHHSAIRRHTCCVTIQAPGICQTSGLFP